MGVRPLTCLCGVHSSVPAGPVSNPSCTRPRVVWYWTSPSGSPPVLSTTSSSLTSPLTSCHLQFLRPLNPLCRQNVHVPRSSSPPLCPVSLSSHFSPPRSPHRPHGVLCVHVSFLLFPPLLFAGLLPSFPRDPSLRAPAATRRPPFPPRPSRVFPRLSF